jgi:hypothetical protein
LGSSIKAPPHWDLGHGTGTELRESSGTTISAIRASLAFAAKSSPGRISPSPKKTRTPALRSRKAASVAAKSRSGEA